MGIPSNGEQTTELVGLLPLVYEELRRVARERMAHLRPGGTVGPTDVVHEALVGLLKRTRQTYEGPDHLIRVASMAMHSILVDAARRRTAAKRGGGLERLPFDNDLPVAAPVEDMLALDDALEKLKTSSHAFYELFMLKVYAGMTLECIAASRGVSTRTVEREWRYVKAVLSRELNGCISSAPA
jgi:RNA polymerase sigma factor (TIGR02999 family)